MCSLEAEAQLDQLSNSAALDSQALGSSSMRSSIHAASVSWVALGLIGIEAASGKRRLEGRAGLQVHRAARAEFLRRAVCLAVDAGRRCGSDAGAVVDAVRGD
jgi:hypothetical protein